MPGHERFLKNMLAGIEAIDVALFVVAADEGWMPQSEEHLAVLDLLGIDSGVIALTKIDAVEPGGRRRSRNRDRAGVGWAPRWKGRRSSRYRPGRVRVWIGCGRNSRRAWPVSNMVVTGRGCGSTGLSRFEVPAPW